MLRATFLSFIASLSNPHTHFPRRLTHSLSFPFFSSKGILLHFLIFVCMGLFSCYLQVLGKDGPEISKTSLSHTQTIFVY